MTESIRKIMVVALVGVLITVSLMISVFSCEALTGVNSETGNISLYSTDQELAAMVEKATTIKVYTDYKDGEYQEVSLNGDSISFDGTGAVVEGSNFIISEPGTYVLNGTLTDGSIIIESAAEENVQLVLENANITCKDGAAVYVKECGKNVILSVPEGTTNSITDGTVYENEEVSAAIFSKADLVINGTGTLNVNANYKDGITSKDDLEITEATLVINAADDGIVGKDSIAVGGGNITIKAEGDGIKSTNSEDTTKGYIVIADGNFILSTGNDGIQAETTLLIVDGQYDITTGEGADAAKSSSGGMGDMPQGAMGGRQMQSTTGAAVESGTTTGGNMEPPTMASDGTSTRPARPEGSENMGQPPQMMQDQQTTTSDTAETESDSMKALKAGSRIVIQEGTFMIDSQDDAVHSNGTLAMATPEFEIAAGDDGLHADTSMEIYGGVVNITQSYEGIESAQITINDGNISIVASDDGINVAGGNDNNSFMGGAAGSDNSTDTSEESQTLTINGGTIDVNATGDGLDMNGSGYITGGVVTVSGPTNNGNGALDYDGVFEVTGGTLLVAGSTGMAQAPSSGTTINTIATAIDTQAAGTEISLVNSTGKTVLSFTPEKEFSYIVISTALIEVGESYTIVAGDTELVSFTSDDVVTNLYSSQGGAGGGMSRPERTTSGGGITMPGGQERPENITQ
jgi:hypothetical protein